MAFYEKTVLSNGMKIVTETIPDVRSVTVGFWVGVGSRNETPDEGGMSHFIEHMLFKGTKTRSAKQISETFDSLGAELNAFTTKEFTCYYTRLLDEHLGVGIEVLADMLQNTLFLDEHIEFERKVVLEEIAMYEDTPDELVHDLFTAALWKEHPLGQQVLGTAASVGAFGHEKALGFVGRNYAPGNIVVAAAGNLKHEQMVELINKHFQLDQAQPPAKNEKQAKAGSAVEVFTKATEQVHICYGTVALNSRHPERFALSIMENLLGGGMSSRLFQKIREERGLAYSVYSYHSLYQDSGNFTVYAGTRPANVNEVMSIILREIDLIKTGGVSVDELERAKEQLKGQLVLGLESTRNRMTRLGKSELSHGEILSVDDLVERVNRVTREDILRLAGDIFKKENMVLTVIGPVKEADLAFG